MEAALVMHRRSIGAREDDLLAAVDHATDGEGALSDFHVSDVERLPLKRLYEFDDIGAWAEWAPGELKAMRARERHEALVHYRGEDFAVLAETWTEKTVPPVAIVIFPPDSDLASGVGDGRGRISVAIGMGWKTMPVVFLT